MVNATDQIVSTSPLFTRVAECLYRHSATEIYYGLVKRRGKQFRKSFKTTDRKLAERKLAEFRSKAGRLIKKDNASKVTFAELADNWFGFHSVRLKPNSVAYVAAAVKKLKRHFGILSVRNITTAEPPPSCQAFAACNNVLKHES